MTSSTLFFCTDHINTPSKKDIKALIGVYFIIALVAFNKGFELSEKLFNRIQVRRVGWQIDQFYLCIYTYLCHSL
jgi:hypothetical protein